MRSLRSEAMLILPDRRLIAWEMLLKEGVTRAMLANDNPTALSENEMIAPFAGRRIHEETERTASLQALVDAARKPFRTRGTVTARARDRQAKT